MVNNGLSWLFPGHCILCGDSGQGIDLCRACAAELPCIDAACRRCGLPMPDRTAPLCGRCLDDPPPFTTCISPLLYLPPVKQLITAFKYEGKLSYGRVLAEVLAEQLRRRPDAAVDLLLPVPLHWRRRWARGFNQAEIIGDTLARALRLPMHTGWLRRLRATPPQQGLSARERTHNLRSAFRVTQPLNRRRVALIDDVVTTGATAAELTRLLLEAGAHSVQVWCLARTP